MYRFRPVRYVDTASQGARVRTHLDHKSDQVWVPTRDTKTFYVATGENVGCGMVGFVAQDEPFNGTPKTINSFPEAGSNLPIGLKRSQSKPACNEHGILPPTEPRWLVDNRQLTLLAREEVTCMSRAGPTSQSQMETSLLALSRGLSNYESPRYRE